MKLCKGLLALTATCFSSRNCESRRTPRLCTTSTKDGKAQLQKAPKPRVTQSCKLKPVVPHSDSYSLWALGQSWKHYRCHLFQILISAGFTWASLKCSTSVCSISRWSLFSLRISSHFLGFKICSYGVWYAAWLLVPSPLDISNSRTT